MRASSCSYPTPRIARSPSARASATLRRTRSVVPTDATVGYATSRIHEEEAMADYIPSPRQWVRDQVELYERSDGKEGTTLRDTGLPVIIVTHTGNKTGAVRKTPLMRVQDGANYVLVGSMGGAPTNPVWVYNLRTNPTAAIRAHAAVQPMHVSADKDEAERTRLWDLAV